MYKLANSFNHNFILSVKIITILLYIVIIILYICITVLILPAVKVVKTADMTMNNF
ncbi:hypothetical protein M066_3577 [Bacteroides fragilis str. I1345]|uniref:Uncharacterized protein n=1 Tax=Bacteroides fragilis str. S36L11 TaxID=1339327 RepID=A0A015Z7N5_BACFG|nr:hypothetical protein M136_5343 [Bacteroides fragilis str. S36L11]EYA49455.1 hypothetical protein M115_0936 [Bacteroides fragilis str. 3719 T6]EYA92528.1 hypothetical protein M135_0870 [Bacteroides fragilis str. S36L5]EYB17525.1 hypothetical protein M066_3577 [Bacteroides fragilis str. I1345]